MTQPNTKAFRANQPATPTNGLPPKGLEKQRKKSRGGLPPGKEDHNPYSDDGLEQRNSRKKRTQIYHDQILDRWSNGGEEQPTVENERNWPQSLFETTGSNNKTNFFHNLLVTLTGEIPHDAKGELASLVLERPDLLASENEWNVLPIIKAAKTLPDLVFLIFNIVVPETTRKILEAHGANPSPCEVCPLWDVSLALMNFRPLREAAPNKDDEVSEVTAVAVHNITTPEAQDDVQASGRPRACLHTKINVETLLDRDKELRRSLKGVLDIPKLACEVLESLLDENRFDTEQENAQAIKLQSFRNILELSPNDAFTTATNSDGYNLLQLAVGLFDKTSIDYDLQYNVIEALVQRSPASIFFEYGTHDGEKKNVYCRLGELRKSADRQRVDDVRNLIKVECIRYSGEGLDPISPDKLKAMKRSLLYGHGETEKKLFLDLTGESAIIDEVYVKMVTSKSGMQLETVLEFVRLPNWKPNGAELYRSKREQRPEPDTLGAFPDPYVGIFDWLWDECKVRKIMTLEIDDSGPEPHTDAAIRAALQGPQLERDFGVEVWKWQKFDMHVGTIVAAVPRAREVHLFSYGNIAVLQGWSCRSGLAKLTELEKLVVNIYSKNPRDKDDCVKYETTFKTRLTKHCLRLKESDIQVMYHGQGGADGSETFLTVAATAGPGPTLSARPKREEWIEELKAYKQFITNLGNAASIEGGKPAPKAKVAILDDGARLADLNGVQSGWSFRADGQEYFVGPSPHGTEMAVCVRDICSVAELYIARLDDSHVSEKSHAFTISSCVKALRWALDLGADVISMSWTYEMRHDNKDPDKTEFEKLVKEAVDSHKAVLFGSLPDLGPNKDASSRSPVGLNNVIKISSATRAGHVVDDNIHQFSEFLLPGHDIESSRRELVRGSSFATAYAAGLAALVLYSFRVLDAFTYDDVDDLARKALRVAKSPEGMKGIFERLAPEPGREAGGINSNIGRFVRPSSVLYGPDTLNMSEEGKVARLRNIVNNLVPDSLIKRVFPGGVPED
ncbi:hypothetical protein CORC01_00637 [Colletotrichum orchidophilum]|uniref:Peptidase S8/S53 domain-containing protein n=1 Tax=Colletotrichum orchidophilum TaxID=1209926 RepID=A0A1G4BSC4_9PEZI|nr:uncharacterized protein CORC01_00637 [Colletotrichum orchidophilum]OHF04298.1 hypothetical protein CORC01_00637 [Colletotrichum orchidophilum]